jgi:uncharacterized protein
MLRRWVTRATLATGRRPGLVLGVALAATVLAAWPAARFRLDADLVSLLPQRSPAAADYRVYLETFGGFEKVFVLVSSPERGEADEDLLIEAAEELASALTASPEVASAWAGLSDEDERFFLESILPLSPLLLEDDGLDEIARRASPEAIRERVQGMRRLAASPAALFLPELIAGDPLGLGEARFQELAGGSTLPVDLTTGALLSEDRATALVVVLPARSAFDAVGGRELQAALDEAGTRAVEAVGAPVRLRAAGGPLYAAHDEAILRDDLTTTVTGTALVVAVILVAAFEGFAIPLAAVLAVFAGLVWTAAAAVGALGSVSAVGVGFAAILVGLGVDYAIHGAARFREELSSGRGAARALAATVRRTGPGIGVSALTTACAFVLLVLAHLRPLRELGLVVAFGILAILAASATIASAWLVLWARRVRRHAPGAVWRELGRAVGSACTLGERFPRAVLSASVVVSILAAAGLLGLFLDTDPRALRPEDHPMLEAERALAEAFPFGLDAATVVVRGRDLDEALGAAARAKAVLRSHLGPGIDLSAPSDWLVSAGRFRERAAALASLRLDAVADLYEEELVRAGFEPAPFAPALGVLRAIARGERPVVPAEREWPVWVRELIRRDEHGALAAVHVRAAPGSGLAEPSAALLSDLQTAAPGAAFASIPRVAGELRELASRDLVRLGGLALLMVGGLVLVSFGGRLREAGLAALPVLLGTLWTFGLWGALGRPLDLISLAVVPVLLGIGADNGLHVLHGARSVPAAGIGGAARAAGRGILLSNLTTCAAFASLLASHMPGLRNAGALVAAGMLFCLVATLLVLPAAGALLRPSRSR